MGVRASITSIVGGSNVLPGQTHYDSFESPAFVATVAAFLDA